MLYSLDTSINKLIGCEWVEAGANIDQKVTKHDPPQTLSVIRESPMKIYVFRLLDQLNLACGAQRPRIRGDLIEPDRLVHFFRDLEKK